MPPPDQERPTEPVVNSRNRKKAQDIPARILFEVVRNGSADMQYWLARGANPNAQDEEGMTPLHHAAALGSRVCIRALVNSGKCDYLIRDNRGRYAFELAIEWARDYAVARLLMKKQLQQAHAQGVPAYVPRR